MRVCVHTEGECENEKKKKANFHTLKISFTLPSMKTTMRSSLSFDRALLLRMALEKDLFTASLFSIYNTFTFQGADQPFRLKLTE